jgi:hypothetical protein
MKARGLEGELLNVQERFQGAKTRPSQSSQPASGSMPETAREQYLRPETNFAGQVDGIFKESLSERV